MNLKPNAGISIDEHGIHWYGIEESEIPNQNNIDAEVARLQAEYDAKDYQRKRQQAYPSIADQLDILYHSGFDAWKSAIQAIKETYPKG